MYQVAFSGHEAVAICHLPDYRLIQLALSDNYYIGKVVPAHLRPAQRGPATGLNADHRREVFGGSGGGV
jgi:hypothetical protein